MTPSATLRAPEPEPRRQLDRTDWTIPPAPSSRRSTRLARWYWPLLAVLTVQAGLSLPLVWSSSAYTEEARYLTVGRLQLAHLLHGQPVPLVAKYLPGSSLIYPPLGALADGVSGLAAARILSLLFMLGATALLWAVTSRWWGRSAGFFAAALWAVSGPTLHLGSFATADAMAQFLLALATWCAVRAGRHFDVAGWMVLSGTALVLANSTVYATVVCDPVVVILAILSGFPRPGGVRALARGAMLLIHGLILTAVLLAVGGAPYRAGLQAAARFGAIAHTSPVVVFHVVGNWVAAIVVAGAVGLLLSLGDRLRWHARLMILVLAAATVVVAMEQAGLNPLGALNEHVSGGMWVGSIAAGYGVARLTAIARPARLRSVAVVLLSLAVLPLAFLGHAQSVRMANWPGSARLVAFLSPRVVKGDRILAENAPVLSYYLSNTGWWQWSTTHYLTLPSGELYNTNDSSTPYIEALGAHYFAFVVLDYADTPHEDGAITGYLKNNPYYKIIGKIPFGGDLPGSYTVWQYSGSLHGSQQTS